MPIKHDREAIQERFAGLYAGSYRGNPYNFEAYWRPVFEAIARRAALRSSRIALVQAERDIYFSSLTDFFGGTGNSTLDYDNYTILACRPDVVVGYWRLRPRPSGKAVKEFVVAIIIEMKRLPSRTLVNPRNGRPYGPAGVVALQRQVLQAQRQGSRQAAIYMRTPAAQMQQYVWVIAATGPDAAVARMTRKHGGPFSQQSDDKILRQLSDEQRLDDRDEFQQMFAPQERAPSTSDAQAELDIPPALNDRGGLRWRGIMHAQSGAFRSLFRSLLVMFEADHPWAKEPVVSEAELAGMDEYL